MEINLKLAQQAKSAGGDKYLIVTASNKESFIYIPQNISRSPDGKCKSDLTLKISTNEGDIAFELVRQGKTGDDRYTSVDPVQWKGDLYMPHSLRNEAGKIYVSL
jgi:hypothetical protein